MIDDFVKSKILKHGKKWGLDFSDNQLNEIVDCVKEGVYAFQLIYNENKRVVFAKKLNFTEVIEGNLNKAGLLTTWAYDGGKQFKYSPIETFVINPQEVRELKIKNLGL